MNLISSLDSVQRGLIYPVKLRGDYLFKSILTFKSQTALMEKRKDLQGARCEVSSMDLAHNRLLLTFSDKLVRIHNMNPPDCQLYQEDGEMKMMAEWKKELGLNPYDETMKSCTFACGRFRKDDCGIFTISGESGSLGVIDTKTLECVGDLGTIRPNIMYEHTFSPSKEFLIGAVGAPNNVHIMDIRLGSISLVLQAPCGRMSSIAWSPSEENKIVTGGTKGEVVMWDVRKTRQYLKKTRFVKRSKKAFFMPELKYDKNGNHLILFSSDGVLRSLHADTLRQKYLLGDLHTRWDRRRFQFDFESRSSPELMFIPNGKSVAVFSVHTGRQLGALRGHNFCVTKVVYNELKNEIYSTGGDISPLIFAPNQSKIRL